MTEYANTTDSVKTVENEAAAAKYWHDMYVATSQQPRPWVDLSDSQIETIYYETVKVHRGAPMPHGQVIFGRAVQDKLRELNT
jgi:hypothetical protein